MRAISAFFALVLLFLPLSAAADGPFIASGATVSLAVTGTTGRVAVPSDAYNNAVRLYNSGSTAVFIACGDSAVVVTTAAGMPVAPGTVEVIGCGKGFIAGITAAGTATLYLTPGAGI